MRCDIQDWFLASSLTKNIAPEQDLFIYFFNFKGLKQF